MRQQANGGMSALPPKADMERLFDPVGVQQE